MPEGDTIFRTARTLERALKGRVVTGFRSTFPLLLRCDDEHPFKGQTIDGVEARGKWMLLSFSGGGILATHLRMNGSWSVYRLGERWHRPQREMRILIETAEFVAVGFQVPVAEMHTAASLRRNERIPAVERDVLRAEFDVEAAVERLRALPEEEIGEALLDQRIMAGVGNEFKSEICFEARVHPFALIGGLGEAKLREVVAVAQRLLRANVLEETRERAFTYRGAWRRTTHASDPREHAWVYERAGQSCRRCGEEIRCARQGRNARVSFWCPCCQRLDEQSR